MQCCTIVNAVFVVGVVFIVGVVFTVGSGDQCRGGLYSTGVHYEHQQMLSRGDCQVRAVRVVTVDSKKSDILTYL